jgi:prepilin-type N-terminal cleavage/methylation domain-containing protein/prepilin-type processing-associated H-X9-DG protein
VKEGTELSRLTRAESGFTLIELLVVIAVIAVLASILFPVFISARNQSYRSTCASNLTQFGRAFMLYADDWQGRLPLPGGISSQIVWIQAETTGDSRQVGALWKYVRTRLSSGSKNNLWSCPCAVKVSDLNNFSPGQNYIMNDYLRAEHCGQVHRTGGFPSGWYSGVLMGQCPRPSRVILLYEGVQDANGYCSRHGSPFFTNSARYAYVNPAFASLKYANIAQNYHNGKSNFLFLDGHVAAMAPSATWSQATYMTHRAGGGTDFPKWVRVYAGYGDTDLWNPHAAGVVFP